MPPARGVSGEKGRRYCKWGCAEGANDFGEVRGISGLASGWLPSHAFSMDVTRTAFGTWNGGRFMHYGQPLDDERWIRTVRHAHERGVRTFLTADVYGNGQADALLGRALSGLPRDSYCLIGTVGHDIYSGKRDGAKGFPRFTHPQLRPPQAYADYLRMAVEKSLERCQTDRFDMVMLHNPDSIGYSHDAVWKGMERLQDAGLTERLGIAPGPANGFTLDILQCFERFGALIDWAMIILNPFEPWPGSLILPAAVRHEVKVLTRVVDFGGIFHGDVRPGHQFGQGDHRSFRPPGWVEAAYERLEHLRPIAEKYGLTPLQLACVWNLQQPAVRSVVPTLIQEVGDGARPIEEKVDDLAATPEGVVLNDESLELIRRVGDNTGCMHLKGASVEHEGEPEPDRWKVSTDLLEVGRRWAVDPKADLIYRHASA